MRLGKHIRRAVSRPAWRFLVSEIRGEIRGKYGDTILNSARTRDGKSNDFAEFSFVSPYS